MSVVAVTGCSGYLGSRLRRFLTDEDKVSRIIGIDIKPPSSESPRLEFHQMDVRDPKLPALLKEKNADRVVHLAFAFNPMHNQAEQHDIDVEGARNVLSATAACGAVHLVAASSTTAFGAFADNPEWFTEEHPIRRQTSFLYPADKYEVEMMLEEFASGHPGVKVAVVRPCMVFGPNVDNFVSRFLLRPPFVPGVGGARPDMQFVHEDDAAEVFMRILEKGAAGYFHAVGEGTVNLERIAKLAGKRIVDLPPGLLYRSVDLLWKLHAPLVEGPSGMLDFVRYRWTASDRLTRERLGIVSMRSSEDVLRLMLSSRGAGSKGK